MPAGRPTKYTPDIVQTICHEIEGGKGLIAICRHESMPSTQTVFTWLDKYPEFLDKYTRAREIQAEVQADEIIDIADTEEDVNRAKIRIDARKWTASKLKPKKYGNFQQIEEVSKQEHSIASDTLEAVKQAAQNVAEILKSSRS